MWRVSPDHFTYVCDPLKTNLLQTCQVVRISRILYEISFKIREYDFRLKNTDFERFKK